MTSLASPDAPYDEKKLLAAVSSLGMRLWQHPGKPGIGVVFCPKCGHQGAAEIVLARWLDDPIGCWRSGEKSCDGRPFRL